MPIRKYYRLNNRITGVSEVRVIDEKGEQLGILPIGEAIRLAQEKQLDLVEIAPMANPPVTKIIDFKKFMYQEKKKGRGRQKGSSETKSVRLTFAIALHDLKTQAQKAAKFLLEGHKVNVEMRILGREWSHENLAREKIHTFLAEIQKTHPSAKIDQGIKKIGNRGLIFTIVK